MSNDHSDKKLVRAGTLLLALALASGCQLLVNYEQPRETGGQCSDSIDNDGNGLVDCDDPSCSAACNPDPGTTHLELHTQPSAQVGQLFGIQAAYLDAMNLPVAGAQLPVTIALQGGSGALTGTSTETPVDGIATFSVSIDTAGAYTIVGHGGTDEATTMIQITDGSGSPTHLVFTMSPTAATAGAILPRVEVTVEDDTGTPVAETIKITLDVSGGSTVLAGGVEQATVNGVAEFDNLVITGTGTAVLTATATTAIPGQSPPFSVAAAATDLLELFVSGPVEAGVPFTVEADFVDAATGQIDMAETDFVMLKLQNAVVTGPQGANAVLGRVQFDNLVIATPATGLQFSAAAGSLQGTSQVFDVVAPPVAASLVFVGQEGGSFTAGNTLSAIGVEILDAHGQPTIGQQVVISLTQGGQIDGTVKLCCGPLLTFDSMIAHTAGPALTLTATSTGVPSIESNTFAITPAAPAAFELSGPPPTVVVGQPFAVSVTVFDPFANRVVDGTPVNVSLLNNPTGASLGGTLARATSNGVVDFGDLTIDKAGATYSLQVSSFAATTTSSLFDAN